MLSPELDRALVGIARTELHAMKYCSNVTIGTIDFLQIGGVGALAASFSVEWQYNCNHYWGSVGDGQEVPRAAGEDSAEAGERKSRNGNGLGSANANRAIVRFSSTAWSL